MKVDVRVRSSFAPMCFRVETHAPDGHAAKFYKRPYFGDVPLEGVRMLTSEAWPFGLKSVTYRLPQVWIDVWLTAENAEDAETLRQLTSKEEL